jgi:dihydroorotase
MNPPLREKEDIDAIIAGLQDGTIDCISTDHAPHAISEKETDMMTAAYGIIGLESAVGLGLTHLVHAGKLSLTDYITKCSVNPRKILKIYPASISESKEANITILDIDKEWTFLDSSIYSKSHNTPFIGTKLKGKAVGVINNGKIAGEIFS